MVVKALMSPPTASTASAMLPGAPLSSAFEEQVLEEVRGPGLPPGPRRPTRCRPRSRCSPSGHRASLGDDRQALVEDRGLRRPPRRSDHAAAALIAPRATVALAGLDARPEPGRGRRTSQRPLPPRCPRRRSTPVPSSARLPPSRPAVPAAAPSRPAPAEVAPATEASCRRPTVARRGRCGARRGSPPVAGGAGLLRRISRQGQGDLALRIDVVDADLDLLAEVERRPRPARPACPGRAWRCGPARPARGGC